MPSEALAEEGCPSAMNIECPATMRRHVQKVLGGEYDIPYRHSAPVILDIGANVGSFAAWRSSAGPGLTSIATNRSPDNFALLKRNLGQFEGRSVSLHNFAVGDPSLTRLYLGRDNCGEGASTISASKRRTRSRSRPKRLTSCPRRTS